MAIISIQPFAPLNPSFNRNNLSFGKQKGLTCNKLSLADRNMVVRRPLLSPPSLGSMRITRSQCEWLSIIRTREILPPRLPTRRLREGLSLALSQSTRSLINITRRASLSTPPPPRTWRRAPMRCREQLLYSYWMAANGDTRSHNHTRLAGRPAASLFGSLVGLCAVACGKGILYRYT